MQVKLNSYSLKYLVISLLAVVVMWSTGYLLGQRAAVLSSDFAYIPLTSFLAVTAFFQVSRLRYEKRDVLAWSVFAVFALTYCIAQHIWSLNEIILDQKPFPSFADVAFTISTICLIIFFILIIKSIKQTTIPKWMYAASISIGCITIGLAAYFFIIENTESTFEDILSLSYPIMDSIALIPALIGVLMYIKGKLDFSMSLICLSMIPLTIGDILFQITTAQGTYYSGSIADLFYYIQITLAIFGVYLVSNSKIKSDMSVSQT